MSALNQIKITERRKKKLKPGLGRNSLPMIADALSLSEMNCFTASAMITDTVQPSAISLETKLFESANNQRWSPVVTDELRFNDNQA